MSEVKVLLRALCNLDFDIKESVFEISERVSGGEDPELVLEDFGLEPDYFWGAMTLGELGEDRLWFWVEFAQKEYCESNSDPEARHWSGYTTWLERNQETDSDEW